MGGGKSMGGTNWTRVSSIKAALPRGRGSNVPEPLRSAAQGHDDVLFGGILEIRSRGRQLAGQRQADWQSLCRASSAGPGSEDRVESGQQLAHRLVQVHPSICLLYTSDAADEN